MRKALCKATALLPLSGAELSGHVKEGPTFKQILLVMRLTVILLTVFCLQVSATSNAQRISLSERNAPLEKVFKLIQNQTGYQFIYTVDVVEKAKKVDISVRNASLEQVLALCFENQPLSYKIVERVIVVKEKETTPTKEDFAVLPPPIDIKGRVVNEKGEPVIATVTVKGMNEAVSTNDKGEFEIKGVDDNAVLVISGVNIETFEVKVNGRSDLAIVKVKTKIQTQDEVVVSTGYQSIPKERATGSFVVVANELLNRSVGGNIINRLEGVTSGLMFFNSLKSSNERNNIQIRSRNTILSDASPLIVLDNFPYEGDIRNINPDDIASVTVLKDAAAASIWGARASNGVIVITSKSGKRQQNVSVSFNTSIDFRAKQDFYLIPTMKPGDVVDLQADLYERGAYKSNINSSGMLRLPAVVDILLERDAGILSETEAQKALDKLKNNDVRKDIEKYLYQQPVFQRYALNLQGSGKNNTFYLSAGMDRNRSAEVGNQDERFTLNGKNNFFFINNKLEIGTDLRIARTSTDRNAPVLPNLDIYDRLVDDNGLSVNLPRQRSAFLDTAGGGRLLDWWYRPIEELNQKNYNMTQLEYLAGLNLKLRITGNVDVQMAYRFEGGLTENNNYDAPESYTVRDLVNKFSSINYNTGVVSRAVPLGGRLSQSVLNSKRHYGRALAHFGKTWNQKHSVDLVAGADVNEIRTEGKGSTYYGYDKEHAFSVPVDFAGSYKNFVNGTWMTIPGDQVITGLTGRAVDVFSNASYSYMGKYTLTASARQDGANIYGVRTNQKWVPLWHAGIKWDIHKEAFFKVNRISSLIFRVTHGYVGNSNNSLSAYLTILKSSSLNNYNSPFAAIQNPPNPDLRGSELQIRILQWMLALITKGSG